MKTTKVQNLNQSLRDPERRRLYCTESFLLSVSCVLAESMQKHRLSKKGLAKKAEVSAIDVERLLDGTVSDESRLAFVARLFAAMGELVEIVAKPLKVRK